MAACGAGLAASWAFDAPSGACVAVALSVIEELKLGETRFKSLAVDNDENFAKRKRAYDLLVSKATEAGVKVPA